MMFFLFLSFVCFLDSWRQENMLLESLRLFTDVLSGPIDFSEKIYGFPPTLRSTLAGNLVVNVPSP